MTPKPPRGEGEAVRTLETGQRADVAPGPSGQENPGKWTVGVLSATLGMAFFSGTAPATKLAAPVFGSTTLTLARIVIAAGFGLVTLALTHQLRFPDRRDLPGVLITGLGLAVGYPLLLALAVQHVPAYHAVVVVGLAPAATATISVLRTGERPRPWFWLGCLVGLAAVVAFAVHEGGGSLHLADGWLIAAVLSVAVGYVEGGRVARRIGALTTLCWALLLLAPAAIAGLLVLAATRTWTGLTWQAWAGLGYAGVFSMFLGSVLWYRGLAAGGIARIGQLNLAQPLLALAWSALLLHERLSWWVSATAVVVVLSVATCINSGPRPTR